MTDHSRHKQPVARVMTPMPHTFAADTKLEDVIAFVSEEVVSHLPVLDGDTLVGVIVTAEIANAEEIGGKPVASLTARDVATPPAYTTDAETPLGTVVEDLIEEHAQHAIVMRDGLVVGIVTHTDLLRLLQELMGDERSQPSPEEIRRRILAEHGRLRTLLDTLTDLAARVGSDEHTPEDRETLGRWIRELGHTLRAHLSLEEQLLLPAVRASDGFGDARADEMLREHEAQRKMLVRIIGEIESAEDHRVQATSVKELVRALREDIEEEEREFLNANLLRDSIIKVDFGG